MIDKYEVSLKIWMEEVGVFIRLEDLDGDLSAEICESHGLVSKFTRVVISWFSSKKIKKVIGLENSCHRNMFIFSA